MKSKNQTGITPASLTTYLRLSTDPAVSRLDALQQSFGLDFAGLNKMMQSYLHGGTFTVVSGVEPAKPYRSTITCRPANEIERDSELALLKMRARPKPARTDGAPLRILQAAESNPKDPRPQELLAECAAFANDSAQAVEYCLKAIELGTINPEVYVHYLRQVFKNTSPDYVMPADVCADYRSKIDRALELAPDSMEAHEVLAKIEAHSAGPRGPVIGKVIENLPYMRDGREQTILSIAILLWRFKEHGKAEEYLNVLLNIPGVNASVKSNAQQLLRRIARDTGKPPPKFPSPAKSPPKPASK